MESQDLRLILFATFRAQYQTDHCPRGVGQHDGARPAREPGRNVRVSIQLAQNDLEARLRLAVSQRPDQIEMAINLEVCRGAWLGDAPQFLLRRACGVIE